MARWQCMIGGGDAEDAATAGVSHLDFPEIVQ